jgi:hypothetical protein
MTTEPARDRVKSPSINFPQSAEEAQRAILQQVRRMLFDEHSAGYSPLTKTRTDDAGLGMKRHSNQTKWLNDAADLIGAIIGDKLDEIEVSI